MHIDWTVNLSSILTLLGSLCTALWLGLQLRDSVRDIAAIVKAHDGDLKDHESRIRYIEHSDRRRLPRFSDATDTDSRD